MNKKELISIARYVLHHAFYSGYTFRTGGSAIGSLGNLRVHPSGYPTQCGGRVIVVSDASSEPVFSYNDKRTYLLPKIGNGISLIVGSFSADNVDARALIKAMATALELKASAPTVTTAHLEKEKGGRVCTMSTVHAARHPDYIFTHTDDTSIDLRSRDDYHRRLVKNRIYQEKIKTYPNWISSLTKPSWVAHSVSMYSKPVTCGPLNHTLSTPRVLTLKAYKEHFFTIAKQIAHNAESRGCLAVALSSCMGRTARATAELIRVLISAEEDSLDEHGLMVAYPKQVANNPNMGNHVIDSIMIAKKD